MTLSRSARRTHSEEMRNIIVVVSPSSFSSSVAECRRSEGASSVFLVRSIIILHWAATAVGAAAAEWE